MRFAKILLIRGNDTKIQPSDKGTVARLSSQLFKPKGSSMRRLLRCRHLRNTIMSSMVALLSCFWTGLVSAGTITDVRFRGLFTETNPFTLAKSELVHLRDKLTNLERFGLLSASGTVSASKGELKLEVNSTVEAGLQISGVQEVLAYASIVERGRMVWTPTGPSDPFATEFVVTAELSGNVSLSDGGNFGSMGAAGRLELNTGLEAVVYGKSFTALDTTFTPNFTGRLAVDSQGGFKLAPSMSLGLNIISDFGALNFGNTFKYTSILMPDGTTPESHGWRLDFESGMQSPNLVAVPEPSSMTLLAIGAFTSGLCTWRRRQGQHTLRRS